MTDTNKDTSDRTNSPEFVYQREILGMLHDYAQKLENLAKHAVSSSMVLSETEAKSRSYEYRRGAKAVRRAAKKLKKEFDELEVKGGGDDT